MSVRPADIRAHLKRLLSEESVQLGRLHEVLQNEADVLRGEDVGAIERIGQRRHDSTTVLTRLDAERRELCRLLPLENGHGNIEQLLGWCDADGELQRLWQANLALARRCREHNDRNGAVVTVKLSHIQKLLAGLRGEAGPAVYSPPNRGITHFAPRELGRA